MDDLLREFSLNNQQLQTLCKLFCQQLHKGLAQSTHNEADMRCFVTYVQDLPNGEEVGRALVLDLGGMNFRVLCVTLKGSEEPVVDAKPYPLPKEMMHAEGHRLFDYVAECLSSFLKERQLSGTRLPLAFTFSFPCTHHSLTKATLVKWTKGFDCAGVVGDDVGALLKAAIERRNDINVDLVAVLNDSTGTLLASAHRNLGSRIGLIVGTGTNVCYMERSSKAEMLDAEYKAKPKIVIDCEWGAFGENGSLDFIRTEYDRELDRSSDNKGQQIFEKMIGGLYLGELVRLVLLKATRMNLMFANNPFRGDIIEKLQQREYFKTTHIFDVEGDCPVEYKTTRNILKELFCIEKAHDDDVRCLRMICEAISMRAGTLVGLGVSGLINRMNQDETIVGVYGSVFRLHPKFERYMRTAMRRMVNPRLAFDLKLIEDGAGRGAAILAVASQNAS